MLIWEDLKDLKQGFTKKACEKKAGAVKTDSGQMQIRNQDINRKNKIKRKAVPYRGCLFLLMNTY